MTIELALAIYVVGVVVTAVLGGLRGVDEENALGSAALWFIVVPCALLLNLYRFGAYLRSKHRG